MTSSPFFGGEPKVAPEVGFGHLSRLFSDIYIKFSLVGKGYSNQLFDNSYHQFHYSLLANLLAVSPSFSVTKWRNNCAVYADYIPGSGCFHVLSKAAPEYKNW